MKKFVLVLVCVFVVVGVATVGHAGLFGLFGGGHGKGKGGSGRSTSPPPGLFKFDFHQFGVKPDNDERDVNNYSSNYLGYYFNLPEMGSSQLNLHHHDGDSNFKHLNVDSTSTGNSQPENRTDGVAPVPEPASMLLFGTGLVAFGFVRRFKKA